ncbi:oligomeric, coiled-coil, peripheral membrane protein [Entomortierella beljakovae]|nr:oligomeric, coiled-coil, peripheral membrane protein [Entomortierella beljakovae]
MLGNRLDTLRLAIEKVTKIPQSSQILMTSEGLQLKPDMMFDAITSTDKDEYTIMVYNREVLTTEISSSILNLTENAKAEPVVPPLSPSQLQAIAIPTRPDSPSVAREWSSQYQRIFEIYASNVLAHYRAIVAHAKICDRIMEELRVQALAVRVALTNLDAHSQSVLETFDKFNSFATKEFTKQAKLLQSFPRDIEVLRQIKVHPALLPAESPERYIADFIPTDKLVLWAERCREIHENLLQDGKDLSRSIKEVQEGTSAIRGNSGINLDQLEIAMAEILQSLENQNKTRERVLRDQSRVKVKLIEISRPSGASASTLEALVQLANVYITDYIESSQKADEMLREKLSIFVSAKRSQTANLITQLMHISKLQSTIAGIPPSLGNLDDALRKRDADFSQLVYVQRIPIAYGALVVEIVRRREYSKLFVQKSQQLGEVMYRFRQIEQRRRDSFRSEIAKFVPVEVPGLDDSPPFCEINTRSTQDRLPPFTRDQVQEFERLINQMSIGLGGQEGNESHVYSTDISNAGASSISSGQDSNQDALSKLRVTLAKMTSQMDVMGGEFDRILEKSFLTERITRLEEDNAKLRADMSRTDIQQRSGTPQLSQQPFSRQGTSAGAAGGSMGQVSAINTGIGIGITTASAMPTSPKLARQPSRGSSAPSNFRNEDDQQLLLQQQLHQNQKLTKENTDLSTKIKAYEARIRSLEEKLYQHFHAGSSIESSISSKDSRQQTLSPTTDQSWKMSEDTQITRSNSQSKDHGRKRDEEKMLALEQELEDITLKLEQTESKLQDERTVSQQALSNQEELRQELLELKLQSATLEGTPEEGQAVDILAAKRRSDELEKELKGMILKHDHLLDHHKSEKETFELETKAFKDRIEELTSQIVLEKEILEGQLDQAKRLAEHASERAKELENELEVVNEELQNKVLELEERLEINFTQHEEIKTRAQEQERQLESHRAVHSDILDQLKEQEQMATRAVEAEKKSNQELLKLQDAHTALEKEHGRLTANAAEGEQKLNNDLLKLQDAHAALEKDHETLLKVHKESQNSKNELVQQSESFQKQISDLEIHQKSYKADVDLRLKEAKTMVQRAEEDWKEKSRLLDQMERVTKELSKPIMDSFAILGLDMTQAETSTLEQVRQKLQAIEHGIKALINKHIAEQKENQKIQDERLSELQNEYQTSVGILNSTIDGLSKARQDAEEGTAAIKVELNTTIDRLKEELENVRIQQRASAIPVPVTSPVMKMSAGASASSAGQSAVSADKSNESFSVNDRILLGSLALDLGIPLPLVSSHDDSLDPSYPSSSMLLDHSEKRAKTESALLTPQPVHAVSPSVIVPSSSGTGRSSSTTTPLSKDILQTFDFSDLSVSEATALIKKKLNDTEHLLKRWQREYKHLKEKYSRVSTEAHDKIAFRNFKVDDLTLFLPTRNSISKPWAAFNINFPHYFLQMTPTMASQLRNREWIVARITSITEAVVDKRLEVEDGSASSSSSPNAVTTHNPFGLGDGVKYYLLEATNWNGHSHGHGHGHGKSSSSYHSSSGRESSSSNKLRHHSSTSALNESSSSSRRDHERSKDRREKDKDSERRKQRDREGDIQESEGGSNLMTVKEENLADAYASDIRGKESSAPSSPALRPAASVPLTALTLTSSSSSSQPQAHSKHTRLSSLSDVSVMEYPAGIDSSSLAQLPPTGQSSASAGNRTSGSAPISIPYQSAATNALRAISSSVGSTGSGSGSVSSLLAHHLGGSGPGSAPSGTHAASSPPRTMLISSSPLITGVTTVSAMGMTVSVNSNNQQSSHSATTSPSLGSMAVFGSSSNSNAPINPSRLSTSSNRDDIEQLAVFATDEEQEQDRQQQRDAFNRTSSTNSTWHG